MLSHRFPERHEGGKLWPPHSPDINPCDIFLWGFLKEKMFQRRPENVAQIRAYILKLCREKFDEGKGSFAGGCEAKRWSH